MKTEGCCAGTRAIHYWTGRGTLCSLDNNVRQMPNHSSDWSAVTCVYCKRQHHINHASREQSLRETAPRQTFVCFVAVGRAL